VMGGTLEKIPEAENQELYSHADFQRS
jgi:hypothetical protein